MGYHQGVGNAKQNIQAKKAHNNYYFVWSQAAQDQVIEVKDVTKVSPTAHSRDYDVNYPKKSTKVMKTHRSTKKYIKDKSSLFI